MSVCLPPSHAAFLKGISNSDLTPWASLPLRVPMMMALQGLVGASRAEAGQGGPGRHLAALKGGAWGEHPVLAWWGRPGVNLGDSLCLRESSPSCRGLQRADAHEVDGRQAHVHSSPVTLGFDPSV